MKPKTANTLILLLAAACFFGSLLINQSVEQPDRKPLRIDEIDTLLVQQIENSLHPEKTATPTPNAYALPANALAISIAAKTKINESEIAAFPANSPELKKHTGYSFLDSDKITFVASKLGLDFKQHFLNSFLVGYRPFEVSEIWMPHQVLSMRLKYQFDHEQFPGFEEIWLSSYQAFQAGRGDCEDHSIALADWLVDMGEDARVVIGTHDGGGHAWVVVIRDTGTFLLEATSKKRQRLWSSYPLASLAQGYEPTAMFNRDYFWTNHDLSQKTNYTGNHWIKSGRVTR